MAIDWIDDYIAGGGNRTRPRDARGRLMSRANYAQALDPFRQELVNWGDGTRFVGGPGIVNRDPGVALAGLDALPPASQPNWQRTTGGYMTPQAQQFGQALPSGPGPMGALPPAGAARPSAASPFVPFGELPAAGQTSSTRPTTPLTQQVAQRMNATAGTGARSAAGRFARGAADEFMGLFRGWNNPAPEGARGMARFPNAGRIGGLAVRGLGGTMIGGIGNRVADGATGGDGLLHDLMSGASTFGGAGFIGGPKLAAVAGGIGGLANMLTGGALVDGASSIPVIGPMFTGAETEAPIDPMVQAAMDYGIASSPEDFTNKMAAIELFTALGVPPDQAMARVFGDSLGMNPTDNRTVESAAIQAMMNPYVESLRASGAAYTDALSGIPNLPPEYASRMASMLPAHAALTSQLADAYMLQAQAMPYYEQRMQPAVAGADVFAQMLAESQ